MEYEMVRFVLELPAISKEGVPMARKNRKHTPKRTTADYVKYAANRKYKDTVFRMLFSDKENLLSLYNAVSGKNYENPDDLEIVTLENAIYMEMKNDLAFIIDTNLYLYEHQSTYNPNMPLRDLFYIAAEYQKLVDNRSLYSSRLQKIPSPVFLVFYNGTEEKEDYWVNYLSEAYENFLGEPNLELKVMTLNINRGHNQELMEQCQILREYAQYVAKVREHKEKMGLDAAINRAVNECIREGILREFLQKNKSEVMAMSIFEYDKEAEERKLREEERRMREAEYENGKSEGITIGKEYGIEIGKQEIVYSLKESGMSEEQISIITKIKAETIQEWLSAK